MAHYFWVMVHLFSSKYDMFRTVLVQLTVALFINIDGTTKKGTMNIYINVMHCVLSK